VVNCRPASLRLRGRDYAATGAHFVTICTHRRACLLGEIRNGIVVHTAIGVIARAEWFATAIVRPYLRLNANEFVIMPNHVHGIIHIQSDRDNGVVGAQRRCAPTASIRNVAPRSLGAIVRAFKSATTMRVNALRGTRRAPLWQRNYHDRVIRDDDERTRIRTYIHDNPARGPDDEDNLAIRALMTPPEVPRKRIGFGAGDR
jgi:putative transposase